MVGSQQPFNLWATISPDDSADLPQFKTGGRLTNALYVGTTGDVVIVGQNNIATTWKAVPAGTILPVAARRVNATNTTATALLACYVV